MKNVLMAKELEEESVPAQSPANKASPKRPIEIKRLNINLPRAVFQDLEDRAKESGRTMTEVMRVGLGLVAIAFEEERKGHKLMIADGNGRPIREIVLPK